MQEQKVRIGFLFTIAQELVITQDGILLVLDVMTQIIEKVWHTLTSQAAESRFLTFIASNSNPDQMMLWS